MHKVIRFQAPLQIGIDEDSADYTLPRTSQPIQRSLMQTCIRRAAPSSVIHLGFFGSVSRKELDMPRGYCEMSSRPWAIYVCVISFYDIDIHVALGRRGRSDVAPA